MFIFGILNERAKLLLFAVVPQTEARDPLRGLLPHFTVGLLPSLLFRNLQLPFNQEEKKKRENQLGCSLPISSPSSTKPFGSEDL